MPGRTPRAVGVIEFSAAMVLSGTLGVLVLESDQPVWNVVFFRCLFGAASLFVYCGMRGFLTPSAFTWFNLLLALGGGVAIVANWVLLFSAYHFGSISVATAVYHTQPFFLIPLGALFLGDRPGIGKIAWIVLAFCGLLLVIEARELSLDLASGDMLGALLAIGAAVLYAIVASLMDYGFYDRRLTTGQMVGIGLILAGSAGVNLNWTLPHAAVRSARESGSGASA